MPSPNEQFGEMAGLARPKFCLTLQRWLSSVLLRNPARRQAPDTLSATATRHRTVSRIRKKF